MPKVQLAKNIKVVDVLTNARLTPIQINVLLSLRSNGGAVEIMELINTVRKKNPSSYRFVLDNYFYSAIASLQTKGLIVYG